MGHGLAIGRVRGALLGSRSGSLRRWRSMAETNEPPRGEGRRGSEFRNGSALVVGARAGHFAFEKACTAMGPPPLFATIATLYWSGMGEIGQVGFGDLPTTGTLSGVPEAPAGML